MADIVPGYDFAVREIPTVETLLKQAAGLQVTGISSSELQAGITGIKSGDVSNVTDSLIVGETVGTMWISPLGDVWVQEQSGPVILSRIRYGWETRRINVQVDDTEINHREPGSVVHQEALFGVWEDLNRAEGVSTRFSGTARFKLADDGSYDDNRPGNHWGLTQGETASSPGRHMRIAFRGIVQFRDRNEGTTTTFSEEHEMQATMRLKRASGVAGTPSMLAENFGTSLTRSSSKWFGWAGCPTPNSSKISDGIGVLGADYKNEFMLWCFGHMSYTNKDTGP